MTESSTPIRLRNNACWAGIAALAQMCCQCALILAIAHFGSTSIVGQYALGLAIATPLSVFADRTLRTIQVTADHNDLSLSDYLTFRAVIGALALATTAAILLVSDFSIDTCQIILLVTLIRFTEGVAQMLYGKMHQQEQLKAVARSQATRLVASTLCVAMVMSATGRLDAALVAGLYVQLVVIAVFDRRELAQLETAVRDVRLVFHRLPSRRLLALCLPLGTATLLVNLNANVPRYLISAYWNEATLGIFSVLCYLSFPGIMLISACLQAVVPRLAHLYRVGSEQTCKSIVLRLIGISAIVGVVNGGLVMWGGRDFLRWAFGADYSHAAPALRWLVIAAGVSYITMIPATLLTAQRRFHAGVATCAVSCVACLSSGIVLIPTYRLDGAAWSMLIGASVHGLAASVALRSGARSDQGQTVDALPRPPERQAHVAWANERPKLTQPGIPNR